MTRTRTLDSITAEEAALFQELALERPAEGTAAELCATGKRATAIRKLWAIEDLTGQPWETLSIQQWKPDTCTCIVRGWKIDGDLTIPNVINPWEDNLEFFDINTGNEHTFEDIDKRPVWDACRHENFRKNRLRQIFINTVQINSSDPILEDSFIRGFYDWNFNNESRLDPDLLLRTLEVFVTATVQQAGNIQATADAQFGVDSIIVIQG